MIPKNFKTNEEISKLWLGRKRELVNYYEDSIKDYPRDITAKKALKKLRDIIACRWNRDH